MQVSAGIASSVSNARQTLCVSFPGLARLDQVPHDVVCIHWSIEAIVVGDDLSSGHHEVVADGRMCVGVALSCEAILGSKAVEIWHSAISDHTRVTMVFFDNQHNRTGLGSWRRWWRIRRRR